MRRSTRLVALGALLALGLTGCDTLDSINPFRERETPLPGARKPVFPPGHPNAGPQGATIPQTHAPAPAAAPATTATPAPAPATTPPAAPARR